MVSCSGSATASSRVFVLEVVVLTPPVFLAERLLAGMCPTEMLNVALVLICTDDTTEVAAGLPEELSY